MKKETDLIFSGFFKIMEESIARILGLWPYQNLWIESPSGKRYELPFKTGMRIIRKRGWLLAEVEPVMSRWQHFKAALGVKTKWR
jgi:hypothetical protein